MQVAVLQRVPTMFLKSKQSIIREKLDLKPQKGSLSLRQDLKSNNNNNDNKGNFICVFEWTIVNLATYRQYTNAA